MIQSKSDNIPVKVKSELLSKRRRSVKGSLSCLFSHFRPKLGCSRRTLSSCFVFPPPSSKSHWPLPIVPPSSLSCLLSMKSTSLSFPFLLFFSLLLHCEEGGWASCNRGNSCCRFCSFSEEQFHQVHYSFCSKV